jgi:hypothetical protein
MGWFGFVGITSGVITLVIGRSMTSASPELLRAVATLAGLAVWYFAFGGILRSKHQKWGIYLVKENEGIRAFKGTPLLAIWVGHFWRLMVINVGIQGAAALLKTAYGSYLTSSTEFAIDILALLSTAYLAFLWLLKYQYGVFKPVGPGDSQLEAGRNTLVEGIVAIPEPGVEKSVSDSVEYLRSLIGGILSTVGVVSYLVIGLVQFVAIYSFFKDYWGWWLIPSGLAAFFISYIPLLGSVAGVIAAIKVWEWSLLSSLLLFFFPIVIMLVVGVLVGFGSLVSGVMKKKSDAVLLP